jgi:tetratricopeptide (TPR) repeat protein
MASIFFRACLVVATACAATFGQDDDGDGPSDAFRKRFADEPIPATADGLDARYEGAVEARRIGDVDKAIGFYREILKTDPKALTVHIAMGTAFWEKGELAEAEQWLLKALEINPKQIKARQFLGQLRMHSGRFAEAITTFDELLKLEKNLDDVVASAHLNLGRIALVKRKFADAEKHFREVEKSPERGDRASAERGLMIALRLRKTTFWNKEITPTIEAYFSPKIAEQGDAAWRKAWVAKREAALKAMYDALQWKIPEPIPVYVYKNDDDCYEISDQETAHSFRYSWWLCHTLANSTPGHDLAHQVVSRRFGARPASVPFVEGLCTYFDGTGADRHAGAKKLLRADKLRDLVDLHSDQRTEEGMHEASASFVAFAIETYGLKKFLDSYRVYNNVMLNPEWRLPGKSYKWSSALDVILKKGLGVSLADFESRWRASLR